MAEYLSTWDVIAIHEDTMRRLGSAPAPLRTEGLLESALMRPRMAAHYEGADLVRQAALLAVGISQAQAFLDGNKRSAYRAMIAFLAVNGHTFVGEPIDLAHRLEAVAEQSAALETATLDFERWLRALVTRRD